MLYITLKSFLYVLSHIKNKKYVQLSIFSSKVLIHILTVLRMRTPSCASNRGNYLAVFSVSLGAFSQSCHIYSGRAVSQKQTGTICSAVPPRTKLNFKSVPVTTMLLLTLW